MSSGNTVLRRCLYGLTALFLAAGAATGADAYYTYLSLQELTPALSIREPKPQSAPRSKKAKKKDYSIITRRNLFASGLLRPVKPRPTVSSTLKPRVRRPLLKRPPLNIRLVGTTVGPEGMRYAIIEGSKSGRHAIYRMGDRVEGALIQDIDRSEVRLLYHDQVKILRAFDPAQKRSVGNSSARLQLRRPAPKKKGISAPRKLN